MFKSLLVKLGHVIDRLLATESLSSKGSQHLRAFPTGIIGQAVGAVEGMAGRAALA